MTFLWPIMLIFLFFVPLAVLLYMRLNRRRTQIAERYSGSGLFKNMTGREPGIRRHIPSILFLIALTIMIFALARPQAEVSLPRVEGTVILAFDVSGSMAADDLKPTRMEAAKSAAEDFVQRQPPTVQIGVVAFSDNGFSGQIPTNDQSLVLAAI